MRQVTKHRTIQSTAKSFSCKLSACKDWTSPCLQTSTHHFLGQLLTLSFSAILYVNREICFLHGLAQNLILWQCILFQDFRIFYYSQRNRIWKAEENLLRKESDKPWVKLPAENIHLSISRPLYMSVFACRCLSSLCLQFQLVAFIFFQGISCLSCPCPTSPLRCASAFPTLAASLISGPCTSPVPSYIEPFRKGFVTQWHHKDW